MVGGVGPGSRSGLQLRAGPTHMNGPTHDKEPKREHTLFLLLILLFRFHLCRISSAVLPHVRKVQTLHNLRQSPAVCSGLASCPRNLSATRWIVQRPFMLDPPCLPRPIYVEAQQHVKSDRELYIDLFVCREKWAGQGRR